MSVANRLLVAGAGTGKTYQLVEQVRALLRAGVPATKLAAITFTEAAAGELQERIRRDIPEFPQASEATIATIHGFCASLLRERPIEAAVTPQFLVLDGLSRTLLLEELWTAWIEEALDHDGAVSQGRIAGVDRETMKQFAFERIERRDKADRLAAGPLAAALAQFGEAYEHAKQERGALDFDDLLSKTRDLLRERSGVREDMRARFSQILVDEFQDTDPIQAEILWLLATAAPPRSDWWTVAPEPGRLFAVGDPFQSIYGFRRADLALFERAAASLEGASPQGREPLSESRRSIPRIVDWVNRAFEKRLSHKLKSVRRNEDAPEGGVFVLLPSEDLSGQKKDAVRAAEAAAIAGFLRERIDRGLAPGDGAILLRALGDAEIYEEALLAADIPVVIEGGKAYFGRREVKILAAWLRAVENPLDKVAVVAALRSPFFGVSDRELAQHAAANSNGGWDYREAPPSVSPASIARAFTRLAADHERSRGISVAAFLERSFEELGVLALLRLQPGGEQRVANLLHAVRMARELESRGPLSLCEFAEFFSRNESELREEGLPAVLEGREAVRILTMHRAKGLEFPLVILPDLARNPPPNKNRLVYDRKTDRLEYSFGDGLESSAGFEAAAKSKKEAEFEESERLLYVAATRARDTLVIPRFPGEKPRADSMFMLLPQSICDLSRTPAEGEYEGAFFVRARSAPKAGWIQAARVSKAEQVREALQARAALSVRLASLAAATVPKPLPLSPSALAAADDEIEVEERKTELRNKTPEFSGARAGSAVHRALALGDWSREESFSEALEGEIRRQRMESDEAAHARQCLANALRLPVFRRASEAKRRYRELPFVARFDSREISGQMDLVFQEKDRWVLVDFKTDRVGASSLEATAQRYRPQIDAYASAIETILGTRVEERVLAFLAAGQEIQLADFSS